MKIKRQEKYCYCNKMTKKVQAMIEMNRKIKADICINKLINKTNPSSLCHQQCDFRYFLYTVVINTYLKGTLIIFSVFTACYFAGNQCQR